MVEDYMKTYLKYSFRLFAAVWGLLQASAMEPKLRDQERQHSLPNNKLKPIFKTYYCLLR